MLAVVAGKGAAGDQHFNLASCIGVHPEDFDILATNAMKDACGLTHAKQLSKEEVSAFVQAGTRAGVRELASAGKGLRPQPYDPRVDFTPAKIPDMPKAWHAVHIRIRWPRSFKARLDTDVHSLALQIM